MVTERNERWRSASRIVAVVVILATVGALATGVAAGSTVESTNASDGPTVQTAWADALGDTHYLVEANLTGLGGADEASVRIEYRPAGTTQWSRTANRTVNRTGAVQFELPGLANDTTYRYRAVATTVDGRDTGTTRNFTTQGNPPVVETRPAANVGEHEVTLRGELLDLGGTDTANVSFYWSALDGLDYGFTEDQTVSSPGNFSETVWLEPNTTYEYTAQASDGNGEWASGSYRTVTTDPAFDLDTRPATNVTATSATLGGVVAEFGDAANANVSFEYREPGTGLIGWTDVDATLASDASFSGSVDGLEPDTTYEFRAVGRASDGDVDTAATVSFTTDSRPAVTTLSASNVTESAATLRGNITDLGGAENATVRFTVDGPDGVELTPQRHVTEPGQFSERVTGLTANQTYEYSAFVATSDGDQAEGQRRSFTTEEAPLAVTTGEATGVNETTATLSGAVTDFGGADGVKPAVEYRPEGATDWSTAGARLASDGSFAASVVGLRADTTYEFRAVATASDEDRATGEVRTFHTEAFPAVETGTATDVNASAATVSATVTDLGGASEGIVRFQYRRADATDWTETDGQSVTETGAVTATLTGLDADTAYEFRVVLDADGDRALGDRGSFTTDTASRPPAVERLSIRDTSGPNPHVDLAVDWRVTDPDSDLATVRITVRDGSGRVVADTRSVSGSSAAGSLGERIKHGSGADYSVTVRVTDAAGNTATETDTLATAGSKKNRKR
ncbi:hypothetical protein BV210_07740 [Halorientalis sp. IM1011]|uniref:fibronectin type III domain-containing protein n=1 Tax=Halorientalis sp. IM1011 TaxID=1932360 RepID=UPI00097CD472|nr:fibronectin type III domain-containing protein [Halorientalis sp. IM1011]AQL42606.1 hypothetical protein BV210_07740 [Halorientalis sp. IM1011]